MHHPSPRRTSWLSYEAPPRRPRDDGIHGQTLENPPRPQRAADTRTPIERKMRKCTMRGARQASRAKRIDLARTVGRADGRPRAFSNDRRLRRCKLLQLPSWLSYVLVERAILTHSISIQQIAIRVSRCNTPSFAVVVSRWVGGLPGQAGGELGWRTWRAGFSPRRRAGGARRGGSHRGRGFARGSGRLAGACP